MSEPVTPVLGTPKPRASQPGAPAKSNVQRIVEGVTDVVAIAGLVALAWIGRLPGEWAGVLVALLAGVRITDIVAGRGGQLPPGGAGGVTGAIVGLVSTLLHRGGGAGALVLALVSAGALASCGGTGPALRTSPVLGYYSSPDWGKCAVGGVRVESAGSVTVTAHGCVRLDGMDASTLPISGFTPLGSTRDPFAAADAGAGGQ